MSLKEWYINMAKQSFHEIYKHSQEEIKNKINILLDIVKQYSPLTILKRCYEEIIHCYLISENRSASPDFEVLQNILPYLQSITYAVKLNDNPKERIEEDIFQNLIKTVKEIYMSTNILLMFDENKHTNNTIDELQLKARLEWLNVKGKRYRCYELTHLQELLQPHNEIFIKTFEMSVASFVENLKNVEYSIIRGYFEAWEILGEAQQEFCKNTDSNPTYTIEQLLSLQADDDKINNAFAKICGYDLFDLNVSASFSEKLLEKLSCGVGKDESFGNGKNAYIPIKKLPVIEKPFLKYLGKYYCFEIQSLYDNLYRNIERIILEENPSYQNKWNKIQGKTCQNITVNLFKNILPKATYLENNYYLSQDNWIENDLLIIYDKVAIIVEIKGGKFKTKSPITDYINYKQSIIKLLEEPINQASRIETLLEKDSEITFYNSNKNQNDNNIKYVLKQSKIEKVFLCSISLDNFNIIANNIPMLKKNGFNMPHNVPIWGLSIDELRVYAHLFEQESLTFLHFLQKRAKASSSPEIDLNDELDHLALYFEFNDYIQHTKELMNEKNITNITYFDYTKDIDDYFIKQERYYQEVERPPKPKQKMPVELRELINLIQTKEQVGCFHVVSSMLDFSGNGRDFLIHLINTALLKQFSTKRLQHLNIIDVSAFCLQDNNIIYTQQNLDELVYASMLIANQSLRYCLKIYFDSKNKIYDIDIQEYTIEINTKNKTKYANTIEMLINCRISQQQARKKKIGRNDPCPCGSGKKYKKCCLKYYE